ncbi:MAG: hypothetical protein IKO30_06695 [Lachnospiraceae bacterium]|nr:hypothetical protein [Lachnospiraceae bacterium]
MAIIAAYTYQNKIFAKMVHCIFMLDDLLMYQNMGKSKLGTPLVPRKHGRGVPKCRKNKFGTPLAPEKNGSSVPKCIKDKLGTPQEPKKHGRGVPKRRKSKLGTPQAPEKQ